MAVPHRILAAALLLSATPAAAQDEPRFCPNRPDLGASGCTVNPGRFLIEMSGIDWEVDDGADTRQDTILAADLLVRTGLDDRTELQLGFTPFGHARTRDKATGSVDTVHGAGDVRIAIRRNLQNPDGSGLSFAVEPFATLPVGREPIGAGDWSAGVVLPISYELSDKWDVGFTGDAGAGVNDSGDGRHFSAGGIVGVGYSFTDRVSGTAEISLRREDDPMRPRTEAVAALSAAWQPRPHYQLDILATAGLNRDTPDFQMQLGGAILF